MNDIIKLVANERVNPVFDIFLWAEMCITYNELIILFHFKYLLSRSNFTSAENVNKPSLQIYVLKLLF